MGSYDVARRLDARAPQGRAWGYDPKNGYRQAQVMFLPGDTMPCPWDPERTLPGARDLLRHRLAQLGYRQEGTGTGTWWSLPDAEE